MPGCCTGFDERSTGGLGCVGRWWNDWRLDTVVWNATSRPKDAGIVLRVPDDAAAGVQCLAANAVDDAEELLGPGSGSGDDAA